MDSYNDKQALAESLFKSARTSGLIDYRTVEEILGITAESLAQKERLDRMKTRMPLPIRFRSTLEEASQKECDVMYRLAQQITCREELRVLASRGLGVPYHRLEASLCNHPGDIQGAAHQALKEWSRAQSGKKQTYRNLCTALEQANMASLIDVLKH